MTPNDPRTGFSPQEGGDLSRVYRVLIRIREFFVRRSGIIFVRSEYMVAPAQHIAPKADTTSLFPSSTDVTPTDRVDAAPVEGAAQSATEEPTSNSRSTSAPEPQATDSAVDEDPTRPIVVQTGPGTASPDTVPTSAVPSPSASEQVPIDAATEPVPVPERITPNHAADNAEPQPPSNDAQPAPIPPAADPSSADDTVPADNGDTQSTASAPSEELPSPEDSATPAPRQDSPTTPSTPAEDAPIRHVDALSSAQLGRYLETVDSGWRRGVTNIGEADLPKAPLFAADENQQLACASSVADVVSHRGLLVGFASTRGLHHQSASLGPSVREDAVACGTAAEGRYIVGAIADGVSAARYSRYGAQLAVKSAIKETRRQLEALTPGEAEWQRHLDFSQVTAYVCASMRNYCSKLGYGRDGKPMLSDDEIAGGILGTTCEVLVVRAADHTGGDAPSTDEPEPIEYIRAMLAGDGSGFILHSGDNYSEDPAAADRVESLSTVRFRNGLYADPNRVVVLPSIQHDDYSIIKAGHERHGDYPIVESGRLQRGDCIMITTDGIGKDMGKHPQVRGYCVKELAGRNVDNPITEWELLRVIQYLFPNSDDDRTVLAVWR